MVDIERWSQQWQLSDVAVMWPGTDRKVNVIAEAKGWARDASSRHTPVQCSAVCSKGSINLRPIHRTRPTFSVSILAGKQTARVFPKMSIDELLYLVPLFFADYRHFM